METFTLLKYWHTLFAGDTTTWPANPCRIISPYSHHHDDGPFFDLEFSLAALENDHEWEETPETESESAGADEEFSDNLNCLEFVPENDCPIEKSEERQGKENTKGPLVSLFARESCPTKHSYSDLNSSSHERPVTKQVVHKYLKLLKPLYSIERMKCGPGRVGFPVSGGDGVSPPWPAAAGKGIEEVPMTHRRQGSGNNNLQSGLKLVLRHLSKSRSSSALVAAPSSGRRSDDSMVELQDGIQGAILYCKRSYSMPTPRVNDI